MTRNQLIATARAEIKAHGFILTLTSIALSNSGVSPAVIEAS